VPQQLSAQEILFLRCAQLLLNVQFIKYVLCIGISLYYKYWLRTYLVFAWRNAGSLKRTLHIMFSAYVFLIFSLSLNNFCYTKPNYLFYEYERPTTPKNSNGFLHLNNWRLRLLFVLPSGKSVLELTVLFKKRETV
jgi:hypothetical protein